MNHITKLALDVDFYDEKEARNFQNKLSGIAQGALLKEVEKVFEEFSRQGLTIQYDKIELDLGVIKEGNFEIDFLRKLRSELREQLRWSTTRIGRGEDLSGIRSLTTGEADLDMMLYFLKTGLLPESRKGIKDKVLQQIFLTLIKEEKRLLVQKVGALIKQTPKVIIRLGTQFPDSIQQPLLEAVVTHKSYQVITQVYKDFQQVQAVQRLNTLGLNGRFNETFWVFVWGNINTFQSVPPSYQELVEKFWAYWKETNIPLVTPTSEDEVRVQNLTSILNDLIAKEDNLQIVDSTSDILATWRNFLKYGGESNQTLQQLVEHLQKNWHKLIADKSDEVLKLLKFHWKDTHIQNRIIKELPERYRISLFKIKYAQQYNPLEDILKQVETLVGKSETTEKEYIHKWYFLMETLLSSNSSNLNLEDLADEFLNRKIIKKGASTTEELIKQLEVFDEQPPKNKYVKKAVEQLGKSVRQERVWQNYKDGRRATQKDIVEWFKTGYIASKVNIKSIYIGIRQELYKESNCIADFMENEKSPSKATIKRLSDVIQFLVKHTNSKFLIKKIVQFVHQYWEDVEDDGIKGLLNELKGTYQLDVQQKERTVRSTLGNNLDTRLKKRFDKKVQNRLQFSDTNLESDLEAIVYYLQIWYAFKQLPSTVKTNPTQLLYNFQTNFPTEFQWWLAGLDSKEKDFWFTHYEDVLEVEREGDLPSTIIDNITSYFVENKSFAVSDSFLWNTIRNLIHSEAQKLYQLIDESLEKEISSLKWLSDLPQTLSQELLNIYRPYFSEKLSPISLEWQKMTVQQDFVSIPSKELEKTVLYASVDFMKSHDKWQEETFVYFLFQSLLEEKLINSQEFFETEWKFVNEKKQQIFTDTKEKLQEYKDGTQRVKSSSSTTTESVQPSEEIQQVINEEDLIRESFIRQVKEYEKRLKELKQEERQLKIIIANKTVASSMIPDLEHALEDNKATQEIYTDTVDFWDSYKQLVIEIEQEVKSWLDIPLQHSFNFLDEFYKNKQEWIKTLKNNEELAEELGELEEPELWEELQTMEEDLRQKESEIRWFVEQLKSLAQLHEKAKTLSSKSELGDKKKEFYLLMQEYMQLEKDYVHKYHKVWADKRTGLNTTLNTLNQQLEQAETIRESLKHDRDKQQQKAEEVEELEKKVRRIRSGENNTVEALEEQLTEMFRLRLRLKEEIEKSRNQTPLEQLEEQEVSGQKEPSKISKEQEISQQKKILTLLEEQIKAIQQKIKRLSEEEETAFKKPKHKQEEIEPVSEKKKKKPFTSISKHIYINNAGIILIHPYIKMLFSRLKLLAGNDFIDEEARIRGIQLLQYIAYKTDTAPEYELALNKVLCGLPLTEPITSNVVLTEEEKKMCEGLLGGVIANWKVIKTLSNDNLRVSFFHREGKLTEKHKFWTLKVQQKGLDVLLDGLPWAISKIKLPWMEKRIEIEWRSK